MTEREDFQGLLADADRGSQDALWELVERVSPYLYRVVRRRMQPSLRRRYESNDFVQMAWASFLLRDRRLTDFRDEKHLRAFLAGVVVNKVLMGARATEGPTRDVSREVVLDGHDAGPSSHDPSPSQVIAFRDAWEVHLSRQPAHHQKIIAMKLSGDTCESIASALQINERTVRRVLKKLTSEVAV